MAKYLFVYHGGRKPESKEDMAEVMNAWGQWFGSMGSAVVDGGNPVGTSSTTALLASRFIAKLKTKTANKVVGTTYACAATALATIHK